MSFTEEMSEDQMLGSVYCTKKDKETKYSKLDKVQTLEDVFILVCKEYFYPNREVSVVEEGNKLNSRWLCRWS